MAVEIKNLVVNVHVNGEAATKMEQQIDNLRSEILADCREFVNDFIEKMKER